ncbi:response regulator transcription factor [Hydrogenimonas thermophila]|uniref:response regulator transcription factor n=1 Tax=Hydrogenimonas thermophila TaxID=223786 RepID=UPI002937138E|nr:response regulator transcription factor [Hydrogenimonas thermophila]WOE70367.1 response regulator transcription factor [Hydrogenimonas thermophila]WOE72882.1 response regulator transcription factor [Hydrogenimonas thermophila]
MKQKILLLEDDRTLGETLEELLQEDGYDVDWVIDGAEAADKTFEQKYDLYIFDINVPEIDGFDLLESLRNAKDDTPTIFISALVDLKTIAKGFELGADDYIKKPFFPEELLIRVNAKLSKASSVIKCGDVEFDPASRTLKRDGHIVPLGEVQLSLLNHFLNNIGQVIDKTVLMDCLEHPSSTALRVAINKLKEKTGLEFKNIRGVGYVLEAC